MTEAREPQTAADTDPPQQDAAVQEPTSAQEPAPEEGRGPEHALEPESDPRSREELLYELREAEARRDEYLDDLRRTRAEFENYRRRMLRDSSTQRELGKAEFAAALLEALDDLDRTVEAVDESSDPAVAKGVGLVVGKLVQALMDQGLERVDEVGVPFDPSLHEAVKHRETGGHEGRQVVAEVLRPGYRLGDRVLRAAMVAVEQ